MPSPRRARRSGIPSHEGAINQSQMGALRLIAPFIRFPTPLGRQVARATCARRGRWACAGRSRDGHTDGRARASSVRMPTNAQTHCPPGGQCAPRGQRRDARQALQLNLAAERSRTSGRRRRQSLKRSTPRRWENLEALGVQAKRGSRHDRAGRGLLGRHEPVSAAPSGQRNELEQDDHDHHDHCDQSQDQDERREKEEDR